VSHILEEIHTERPGEAIAAAKATQGQSQSFTQLRSLRRLEKQHLPFLRSMEDYELVCEVGHHEESGRPLSMKQLYLLNLGSVPTVQRRLRRLRQLGVIVPRRSTSDGRSVELTVSPRVRKSCGHYLELLRSAPAEEAETA
jgi:hypothetical protein